MYKVLVVDDSRFFRNRVKELIDSSPGLQVVGTACNGQEAIEQVQRLMPDAITMDIEMPVMDGITAVRRIMARRPTPILMFSSLTREGAQATLDALEAGALDFLPKRFDEMIRDSEGMGNILSQRIRAIVSQRGQLHRPQRVTPRTARLTTSSRQPLAAASKPAPSVALRSTRPEPSPPVKRQAQHRASGKQYQLLAIGTSTGGPVALQTILTRLPADFRLPILLVQHMPATFTPAFAQRLDSLCKISVKEASDGDILRPGYAYLAPGGRQMMLEPRGSQHKIRIFDSKERVSYKPSVDITFASCANAFHGKVLAPVLTGMGADGRDGARVLKQQGATIWAQDEASCVVYGMPQAVMKAGLADAEFPLEQMADAILRETGHV